MIIHQTDNVAEATYSGYNWSEIEQYIKHSYHSNILSINALHGRLAKQYTLYTVSDDALYVFKHSIDGKTLVPLRVCSI